MFQSTLMSRTTRVDDSGMLAPSYPAKSGSTQTRTNVDSDTLSRAATPMWHPGMVAELGALSTPMAPQTPELKNPSSRRGYQQPYLGVLRAPTLFPKKVSTAQQPEKRVVGFDIHASHLVDGE